MALLTAVFFLFTAMLLGADRADTMQTGKQKPMHHYHETAGHFLVAAKLPSRWSLVEFVRSRAAKSKGSSDLGVSDFHSSTGALIMPVGSLTEFILGDMAGVMPGVGGHARIADMFNQYMDMGGQIIVEIVDLPKSLSPNSPNSQLYQNFKDTITPSIMRRDTLGKATDLTFLIHLPTTTAIRVYFEGVEPLEKFISALHTALETAQVKPVDALEAHKFARYAFGIAGNASQKELEEEYAYMRHPDFHKLVKGARYFFLGHPEEVQMDAPVEMVDKIEKAVFPGLEGSRLEQLSNKVIVELPYSLGTLDGLNQLKTHYARWRELIKKREEGGKGVFGIAVRAHNPDLIGPADRFMIELRNQFRRRDGVPENEL